MKFSKGASPTPLTVTSQSFMSIDGKLQTTENDKQPNTNIKPFGMCSVLRSPCTPALLN
ncbi:PAAR-like protein [Chryseobacterium sp. JK1]|uniref:PAAR-like protein n=1 Tax=Chryseobacterium sp. JK1 TaxID=874294 RepID=UPI003D68426F